MALSSIAVGDDAAVRQHEGDAVHAVAALTVGQHGTVTDIGLGTIGLGEGWGSG